MTKRTASKKLIEVAAAPSQSRAAAYLRMSTESQRYSIGNQIKVIQEYADRNQISVVRIYKDEGKSGLTIDARKGLAELIGNIIAGRNDFSEVLVFDVSRWGRFQDLDESAHYEFLCRHNGVRVTYCEDLFVNDGNPYIRRRQGAEACPGGRRQPDQKCARVRNLVPFGKQRTSHRRSGAIRICARCSRSGPSETATLGARHTASRPR